MWMMQKINNIKKRAGHIFSECVLWAWWRRAWNKRGGKQIKREKLFRNQLGIVCSYQNTLLTQTCHGANICSQLAESVRGMLSVYCTQTQEHQELTWHVGHKREELLKAPVSSKGRKLAPLMEKLFILTYKQTCRFSLQKWVSSNVGNRKKEGLILDF